MQTVIKVPLRSVVKDDITVHRIVGIVGPVNRLVAETYSVLRLFAAHELDQGRDPPPLTESLLRCAMWCLTLPSRGHPARTDLDLRATMLGLVPVLMRQAFEKPANSRQILTMERNKMVTCLNVAIQEFFISTRRCFINRTLKRGKFRNYYHFIST